jgi:hypothetical protein
MTPGNYSLAIYRGDSYKWQFKLWSDTAKTQPVDLTGVTVKAEIRDRPGGNLLGTLACAITMPNIINASLTSTDTALLTSGAWDMQLTYSDGEVSTVLSGLVTVTMDVTDSAAMMKRLRSVGRS